MHRVPSDRARAPSWKPPVRRLDIAEGEEEGSPVGVLESAGLCPLGMHGGSPVLIWVAGVVEDALSCFGSLAASKGQTLLPCVPGRNCRSAGRLALMLGEGHGPP